MMRTVDILSDYYRMTGFPFQRLDGLMPNDLRVRAVDHYNAPESTDYAFLLSARAGGLGIHLATADTVPYLTLTGIHRTIFGRNLVRIASDKQTTLKYSDCLAEKLSKKISLNRRSENTSSIILLFHGMEGDELDKDGKNKFNKQELKAILRFGAEKLFKESGPTTDDGLVGSTMNGGISTGAPYLSPAEDATGAEGRVPEVDDIDELCRARRRSP
jgi:hypothetical protein